MSMQKLESMRVFHQKLFQAKTTPKRDRILMAMQDPKLRNLLAADEEKYMDAVVIAASILTRPNIKLSKAVQKLNVTTGFCLPTCYKIMNDASYIYGEIMQVSRMFLISMQRERLQAIIKHLQDEPKPDYKTILMAEKLLMDLDDLQKALPQAETDEVQDLTIPSITFTDDPHTIQEAQVVEEEE